MKTRAGDDFILSSREFTGTAHPTKGADSTMSELGGRQRDDR